MKPGNTVRFPEGRGGVERLLRLSVYSPSSAGAPKRAPTVRVAPQIAGTSWNSQRDLKRVKITAEEATEASLSKAALSRGPGVRGGREGASQRHDIHFITLKPTVGSTRSPGFPVVSQRME